MGDTPSPLSPAAHEPDISYLVELPDRESCESTAPLVKAPPSTSESLDESTVPIVKAPRRLPSRLTSRLLGSLPPDTPTGAPGRQPPARRADRRQLRMIQVRKNSRIRPRSP